MRLSVRPPDYETPVALLDSVITPIERFYVRCHLPVPPTADLQAWSLRVEGEVTTPASLTVAELAGTASGHHHRHAGVCRQRARLLRAAGRRHPVEEGRRRYRAVDRSAPGRRPHSRRRQEHRPFRAHGRRRSTARHHAALRPAGADGEGHARRHGHRLRNERSAHSPDPWCAAPGDCSGLGRRVLREMAEPLAGVGDRIRQLLGGHRLPLSGQARRPGRRGRGEGHGAAHRAGREVVDHHAARRRGGVVGASRRGRIRLGRGSRHRPRGHLGRSRRDLAAGKAGWRAAALHLAPLRIRLHARTAGLVPDPLARHRYERQRPAGRVALESIRISLEPVPTACGSR